MHRIVVIISADTEWRVLGEGFIGRVNAGWAMGG